MDNGTGEDDGEVNNDNVNAHNEEERLQSYILNYTQNNLKPSLRKIMELEGDERKAYLEELAKREAERLYPTITATSSQVVDTPSISSFTNVEMEELLSSKLVQLSPAEIQRARSCANYPIFRNGRDNMGRMSFLFDEIPFDLERPLDRRRLLGVYDVYYHYDELDWGALAGWDVPSKRRDQEKGWIAIGVDSANSRALEGHLFFVPTDDDDDDGEEEEEYSEEYYSEVDDGDDDESEASSEGTATTEEDTSDGENQDEEESIIERDEMESMNEIQHGIAERGIGDDDASHVSVEFGVLEEDDDDDGRHLESDNSESEDEQSLESEESRNINEVHNDSESESEDEDTEEEMDDEMSFQRYIDNFSFFHFNEGRFVLDDDHKYASWHASDCECNFGLITHPVRNDDDDDDVANEDDARESGDSLTIFRANEFMAFARGEKQQFISLDKPLNYGIKCGSHYDHVYGDMMAYNNDETQRIKVVQKMQAYRGSWICKLFPSDMVLPEGVAHLIWEYWQTGPPPFLFVNKGDLLLLARCKESLPDPEFPDILSANVTREHLILAKPRRER